MRFALALLVIASLVRMDSAATSQTSSTPADTVVPAPPEFRDLRSRLLQRVERREVPSLAVGVIADRRIVWAEVIGWADREAGIPATAQTLYAVASVSKSITATGALALVGQGKLRLDQPVNRVFAGAARAGATDEVVTVANLMAHTSGVPHLWHYEYSDRPASRVSRVRLIRDNAFLAASPGAHFLYSNLGYGVLAQVVEEAGGESFQRVMEQVLFGPLDMRHTTVDAWLGEAGSVRAYEGDGQPLLYRLRLAPDGGAGFFSTLGDLIRYSEFHLGAPNSTEGLRGAAITAALGKLPAGGHYLRGWGVVRLDGATVLISDGEMAGGTAAVVLVPERRVGAVVLCNTAGCSAGETALAALSVLVPRLSGRFAAGVQALERAISAPREPPGGRYEGSLFGLDELVPASVDFGDPGGPILRLREATYRLEELRWSFGLLEATLRPTAAPASSGTAAAERILKLWRRGDELGGVLQEEVRDDRPGFARLREVVLKASPGER